MATLTEEYRLAFETEYIKFIGGYGSDRTLSRFNRRQLLETILKIFVGAEKVSKERLEHVVQYFTDMWKESKMSMYEVTGTDPYDFVKRAMYAMYNITFPRDVQVERKVIKAIADALDVDLQDLYEANDTDEEFVEKFNRLFYQDV